MPILIRLLLVSFNRLTPPLELDPIGNTIIVRGKEGTQDNQHGFSTVMTEYMTTAFIAAASDCYFDAITVERE